METGYYFLSSSSDFTSLKKFCQNKIKGEAVKAVACGAGVVILPRQHGADVNEHELKKALGFVDEYDELRKEKQQLEKKIAKLEEENAVLRDKYHTVKQEQSKVKEKFVINDSDGEKFFVNLTPDQIRLLDYLSSVLNYNIDYSDFKESTFVDV